MTTSHEKWLKFYTDFDEKITKSSQGSIFWTSSESDHDDNISESPVKKRRISIESSSSERSEISNNDVRSPTLNSNWKNDSPVLSCKLRLDISPILVNKFKRCRKRVEAKLDQTPLYCTPDLFNSQSSQIIEDDVPDASQKLCKPELDVSNATEIEATQSSVVIEPVFSQNASIIAEYGSENSKALTESSNSGSSSYHVPRKKRKYKKGSLAKEVYNMIQTQSFRCKVWEIYKNKSTTNDDISIKCNVKKDWKDYGTSVLECSVVGSSRDATERTILICLSPMINITFEVGSICEFFEPYIEKTILYNNQDVACYINVIKIQLIVET
nr:unnamed protein product [Callosobruchus chinensis]